MSVLRAIAKEIIGLFVDDSFLAAAALILLGTAGVLIKAVGLSPLAIGVLLWAGCLGALWLSMRRATGGIHGSRDKRGNP
jgi:hypothetical protein